jgi:hypothetical protein
VGVLIVPDAMRDIVVSESETGTGFQIIHGWVQPSGLSIIEGWFLV